MKMIEKKEIMSTCEEKQLFPSIFEQNDHCGSFFQPHGTETFPEENLAWLLCHPCTEHNPKFSEHQSYLHNL